MQIETQIFPSRDKVKETNIYFDIWLSTSKAKTFDDCKAKFKYNYIEKLPKKDWDFLTFGKFLHSVLENFHSYLIKNPKAKQDWQPVLKRGWGLAVKEYGEKLTVDQKLEAGPIIKEYRDILIEKGLPNVTAVEKNFYISVSNNEKNVLLNGFIDRIQLDEDGILHVSDYKTTKNLKYLKKDFFQLQTYAFALMHENKDLDRVRASYIGLRHGFKEITQEYTRDDIMPLGEKFIEYCTNIMKEKMWRPNPTPLCEYCDYNDVCKAGERYLIKRGKKEISQNVGKSSWS